MKDQNMLNELEQLKQKVEALEKSRPVGFRAYMRKAFMKTHVIAGVVIAAVISSFVIYAATVSKPFTFADGNIISAAEVNSTFDTLYNLVNGNLNDDNISGISGTKINAGEVNAARLPSSVKRNITCVRGITYINGGGMGGQVPVPGGVLPSISLTTSGKPVKISFACLGMVTAGAFCNLHVYMDGSAMTAYMVSNPGFLAEMYSNNSTNEGTLGFEYVFTGIPAGSHTFTMYYRLGGNTSSIFFHSGTFIAEELTSM
jgi:hypothetical protein